MGWERKRGKLMDLNKLLRKQVRQLPGQDRRSLDTVASSLRYHARFRHRTAARIGQRMIGTLAHPLNQAIIDPEKNIVVAGYGILQPRVGVSVQSAARSRLANIYSGQTGFDIYTRRHFRRVSGSLRRRHFCGQGNLRSGHRTPGSRSALPAQCLAQS